MHLRSRVVLLRCGLVLSLGACDSDEDKAKDLDAGLPDAGMAADTGSASEASAPFFAGAPEAALRPAPGAAQFFLPAESDFYGFHSWASMAAEAPPEAPPGPHSLGNMTVYINKPPPSGSKEFPVGTLIVKETNEPNPADRQVFALAKRGGDYNAAGARGWEWFEFTNRADGTVFQKWRGLGPPPTSGSDPDDNCSGYGGDPAVCNGCHLAASANDYIWTVGYDLRKF